MITYDIDQEQIERNEAAYCEWFDEGRMDALAGALPQDPNDAYLNGYVQGIKLLPLNADGKVYRPVVAAIPGLDEF